MMFQKYVFEGDCNCPMFKMATREFGPGRFVNPAGGWNLKDHNALN